MNITSSSGNGNSALRPEFTRFAAQYGVSSEDLNANIRTLDSVAQGDGEASLPKVLEKMAVTYAKTDQMIKEGKPDDEIDKMQKETAAYYEEHQDSTALAGEILERTQEVLTTGPLPAGYKGEENGIFAIDVYQMNWKHADGILAGKLGEVLVDTTPGADGLVYYIHQTGTPDPDLEFPGF
jgi:hypothetical protein